MTRYADPGEAIRRAVYKVWRHRAKGLQEIDRDDVLNEVLYSTSKWYGKTFGCGDWLFTFDDCIRRIKAYAATAAYNRIADGVTDSAEYTERLAAYREALRPGNVWQGKGAPDIRRHDVIEDAIIGQIDHARGRAPLNAPLEAVYYWHEVADQCRAILRWRWDVATAERLLNALQLQPSARKAREQSPRTRLVLTLTANPGLIGLDRLPTARELAAVALLCGYGRDIELTTTTEVDDPIDQEYDRMRKILCRYRSATHNSPQVETTSIEAQPKDLEFFIASENENTNPGSTL